MKKALRIKDLDKKLAWDQGIVCACCKEVASGHIVRGALRGRSRTVRYANVCTDCADANVVPELSRTYKI